MEIIDITKERTEEKERAKEISELAKKVFDLPVSQTAGYIYVGELPDNVVSFHSMITRLDLRNPNYLEKAKEFAEQYKKRFGMDITIYTDYS